MKILQLTAPGPYGGLERVVDMLCGGLGAAGHDVLACVILNSSGHSLTPILEDHGCTVEELVFSRRGYLRERAVIRSVASDFSPDVIHLHGYRSDVLHGPSLERLGHKVVSTAHGFAYGDLRNRFYEWLQRRALQKVSCVFSVTTPLARMLVDAGVSEDRVVVMPNAWSGGSYSASRADARRHLEIADDALVVGWVGRVTHVKGLDLLLKALPLTGNERMSAVVLGDGPELESCKKLSDQLGLSSRVRFLGAVADAGRYISAFDLFALTSRVDYCPIVLFEALSAGIPIVAARVGGIPDVVSDNEATLVEPDSATELSVAIQSVLGDPTTSDEKARLGIRLLEEKFSIDQWIHRHEDAYLRVTSEATSGPTRTA